MSTEPKNIRLDAIVFQALQEAAAREGKPLDEMANQVVLTGLSADKLSMVQKVLAKGHRYGAASGIREEEVVDVVRRHRQRNSNASRHLRHQCSCQCSEL